MKKRDVKIAKRLARGESVASVADRYEITTRRARQIAAPVTGPQRAGRKPTGAVTPHTARGRTALATLVADAAAAGIEVEAYLDRVREMTRAG